MSVIKFYGDISPNNHFINDSADSLKGIFSKLVSTFLEMYAN